MLKLRRRAGPRLSVVPLGGLGEIGKNMMVLDDGRDILVIDAGLMFPKEEMLGIDLVIPDISYLLEHKERVRAIIITHGHDDHIGALPYILPKLPVPVYAPRLAHGFISNMLKEHRQLKEAKLHIIEAGDTLTFGSFKVEFLKVNHSIPDAVALAIQTPLGVIIHSGDFKLDYTPVYGGPADLARLAQLGAPGILLLLSDSTYAEVAGYTPSERVVGETLDRVLAEAPGRVIVATFSSLISRVQQVMDAAQRHERRVAVVGRSMSQAVEMTLKLGYLKAPEGLFLRPQEISRLPPKKVAVIATGTQGEPTSALVRMANRDHPLVKIMPGDTVVISATAIPGNETLVAKTIDNLFRQGANVLYDKIAPVHVHGHGSQEEQKLLLTLTHPRYFLPVHGEYRHLVLHARLAQELGIPAENTFVLEDGDVLVLTPRGARKEGRVSSGNVLVDGLTVGDVDSVVLRDRHLLARDGIAMVIIALDRQTRRLAAQPDVVSRGFVEEKESEALLAEARKLIEDTLNRGGRHPLEAGFVEAKVKETLSKFFYEKTKRRPMILPVTVTV